MLFHSQSSSKSSTSNVNTTAIPNLWKEDSSSCEKVEMIDREGILLVIHVIFRTYKPVMSGNWKQARNSDLCRTFGVWFICSI